MPDQSINRVSGGAMVVLSLVALVTVLTGFGLPESNVHSPNEKFLVDYFEKGIDTAAAVYTKFAELPKD